MSNIAGKASPDRSIREYEYSRKVVAELYKALWDAGYSVVIDYAAESFAKGQSDELEKRVNVVNNLCKKYGASNCIYVSIHLNAAPPNDGQWHGARGWSIYTSKGKTKADELATCIWNAANELWPHDNKTAMRKDMSDGDPDYEADFYVLRKTLCPAVLSENGFQDNKEDVKYLLSDEGIATLVEIHKRGIIEYFKKVK